MLEARYGYSNRIRVQDLEQRSVRPSPSANIGANLATHGELKALIDYCALVRQQLPTIESKLCIRIGRIPAPINQLKASLLAKQYVWQVRKRGDDLTL